MVEITDGLTRVPNSVENFVGFDEPNSYDTVIAADCLIEGTNVPSPSALTDVKQNDRGIKVTVDRGRDARLTDFGKATLLDRYLMPGEHFQDLFARVAMHFADDTNHAQRLYDYISNLWFMPSTPVLSNGGTTRGLPISCFLNEANDSLDGILGLLRRTGHDDVGHLVYS